MSAHEHPRWRDTFEKDMDFAFSDKKPICPLKTGGCEFVRGDSTQNSTLIPQLTVSFPGAIAFDEETLVVL